MNEGLWLITSGAFVSQELAAEFGQLPPSFLPVGTRRLYEYQVERIGAARPIYITIPETYVVPTHDEKRLAELGVTALHVPDGLALGEAVVFALNLIGGPDQPVFILHGDTLLDTLPAGELDIIGIADSSEGYSWAEVALDGDRVVGLHTVPAGGSEGPRLPVACGLFTFAHTTGLVRGITRARGSFVAGMLDYAKAHGLRALPVGGWYDFGHVQTFFRSRRLVTSARHFNALRIDGRTARKTSSDAMKMRAEASWLSCVPPKLRIFTARLIDAGDAADGSAFYETEYSYVPTLAELFVFGTVGIATWSQVLVSCGEFLSQAASMRTEQPAAPLLHQLVVSKTMSRLRHFADETGFDIEAMLRYDGRPLPSLRQVAEDAASQIDFRSGRQAHVMHGDFCFSNILYDSRVQRIHVIDPRGYVWDGTPTTDGDLRYDMAKFAHSIAGRYDQIIAGRYHLEASEPGRFKITFEQAPHQSWLETELGRFTVDGVCAGGREVRAATVCLFLSMLPLHSDRPDRQKAFVANALRLYAGLESNAA